MKIKSTQPSEYLESIVYAVAAHVGLIMANYQPGISRRALKIERMNQSDSEFRHHAYLLVSMAALLLFSCCSFAQPATINDVGLVAATSKLLSGSISNPAVPPSPWVAETLAAVSCSAPPKIDGQLNDPCWTTATHISGFYRSVGSTPVTEQTEAWICVDKSRLYIAFHCQDDHPNLIYASQTQRNSGIGSDDWIAFDIDSQGNRRNFSTYLVTARGTQAEYIEGGGADNITWAGDWKAATARVKDGWTAELSIPFALLRYPRGAKSFNIALVRKLARETVTEIWPNFPLGANVNPAQYLATITGMDTPHYAPRPVFLPYVLTSAGQSSQTKEGLDIKYPLTTTMTGLLTVHPDFATVEQAVTNINFSYEAQYVPDYRPFFAEGSGFFHGSDLFYSSAISTIDEGLKLEGKQGSTSLGLLQTNTGGGNWQHAVVLSAAQDVGLLSNLEFDYAGDNQAGKQSNQVLKLVGTLGWQAGRDYYSVQAVDMPSWVGGRPMDSKHYASFLTTPPQGQPWFQLQYLDIGPQFTSDLGYNPEVNTRGYTATVGQSNRFGQGHVESYSVTANVNSTDYHTGGFFHDDIYLSGSIGIRSGQSFSLYTDFGNRNQYHDHTAGGTFAWGAKTLYQGGSLNVNVGRVQASTYRYTSFAQSVLVTKRFSVQTTINHRYLKGSNASQSVFTGNYLLNSTRAIGARLVTQNSESDLYLSFSQRVTSGTDLFVLFGDPNSPRTRNVITVKMVTPF